MAILKSEKEAEKICQMQAQVDQLYVEETPKSHWSRTVC